MKTFIKSLVLVAVAATMLVSCKKDKEAPAPIDQTPAGVTAFKFYANTDGVATKATLTPNEDETSFAAAWEDGDEMVIESLSLNPEFDEFGTAVWDSSEEVFNATYDESVTLPTASGDWTYSAWYPAKTNVPFQSNRVQNGNAYNSGYDLMYGSIEVNGAQIGKNANGTSLVIPMNRLTAIAYYHITSDLDEEVVSATLTVDEGKTIAAETVEISADGKTITPTNGSNTITITFEDGKAPKATDFQLWFNILTENIGSASSYNVTVDIVTTGHTAKLTSKSARTFTAGKLNRAKISSLTWSSSAAAAGTVLFDEPFDGFNADDVPSAPGTSATVYGSASVSYTCVSGTNGNTKVYEDVLAGGESPELLVSKNSGSLTLSNIPTGNNEKVTVTWNSNNTNIKLFLGEDQQTAELIDTKLYQAVLDVSGASFNITFKNTTTSNGRLDNIHIVAGAPVVLEKVATPEFSPAGGSYNTTQNVTISCETSGATIYYTTESSEYSAGDWTEYTAAFDVASTSTVKAIAVKDGMTNSDVATASYTISSGTGSGTYYTKVTSVDAIASGNQYVIVGSTSEKNYALPAEPTLSSGKIAGTEIAITSNGISDADVAECLWTLTKSGDYYILSDGNGYLYHAQGGASGTNLGYGNSASYSWSITAAPEGSNGTFKFAGVNNNTVKDRGMLVTTNGQFGGYSLSNITNSGYCGIDLYTLSDGKSSADISYNPVSATITYGESLTQPTLSNAHGLSVSYASSNTAVATVASNGVIAVTGCGEATIICSWDEQTISGTTYRAGSATFALTVNKIAVTVAFSDPTTAVAVGSTVTNVATVTPSGLTLSYESSNTNVATVTSAGVVTGVAKGLATITATYAGDATHTSASANYQITVGSANDGSQSKPFTVEEVREYMDASTDNRGPVYIQGIVSSVYAEYDQTHGTGIFYISDDGETTSAQFEAYSVKFLGNNAWVNGNTQIAVGDEVIIYGGELTIYTPQNSNSSIYETKSQSGSYLYSLNGSAEIETVPTITKTDITGIAAAGVSGATTTVSFADNDGWTPSVTPDGTIVTSASLSGTTITYSVAENTDDARTGSITVTLSKSGRTDVIATISVAQLAGNGNPSITDNITSGTFTSANDKLTLSLSSGVTIEQSKVSGSTNVNATYNTVSTLRVYKGHALTFSGKTFTRIEIVVNNSYYGNNLTANTGTLTPTTTNGGTIVWEGESDNVVITNNGDTGVSTQLRTTSFKVTYE